MAMLELDSAGDGRDMENWDERWVDDMPCTEQAAQDIPY